MTIKFCFGYAATFGATLLFGFLIFGASNSQRSLAQQDDSHAATMNLESQRQYGETD